ncbi:MAG: lactate/malate family dehydrogenase, partial [Culicoidibacterales bacterium]
MQTITPQRKVVIIGTGLVGSSCAFSFVHQGLGDELVLIDLNHERAVGEALDLQHALPYLPKRMIVRAGSYADCHDANIVVIAAGAPPKVGETRLDSLQTSVKICQAIVPEVMNSGFHGHFLVISNPVDLIAYYVWQLSGLPANQVIGTGTAIDTARLQTLLGERLKINPKSVYASVLGEHGDSQLVAWS